MSRTSRFSVLLAAKSTSVPGNVLMTIGLSSAPGFRLQLTPATSRRGIPAGVLKCCKEILITDLHEILCLCWSEGEVPQDMKNANVVTLYKNKDDRSDYNHYRGISLLSIVGKVFARGVLKRLQVFAEQV